MTSVTGLSFGRVVAGLFAVLLFAGLLVSIAPNFVSPPAPEITNTLGMKLVLIPAGTFWMGGAGGKPGTRQENIPRAFYLGAYTVTQEQWLNHMGSNPSHFSRTGNGKEQVKEIADAELKQFPVEYVSWDDIQVFIRKLNSREKKSGWKYRLPTNVEWEYSCRGGAASQEDCSFDFYLDQPTNDLSSKQANFNGNFPGGDAPKGPFLARPTKVGSYPPNRLGLYDMHGNVWQWCEDIHSGPDRVIRGGSWFRAGYNCRAAYCIGRAPTYRFNGVGFRLALVPYGK